MDRQTLSNYGWIVIAVLILAVMLAFATPFGKYIGKGVSNLAMTMVGASDNAVKKNNIEQMGKEWDEYLNPVIAGATFTDGTFLTWDELQDLSNGKTYGYNARQIYDTEIAHGAFKDCHTLERIVLPDSVTIIRESAFNNCISLESIDLRGCANLATIGNYAFDNCTSLGSITLPDSVTTIGGYAFDNCIFLKSIDLSGCTNLTTLGNSIFYNCIRLKSITLPDSLTTICNSTFQDCDSLESITIPDGVTSIGIAAFYSCDSLTTITFEGTTAQWNSITKGNYWNSYVPVTKVICSDGEVTL